MQSSRPPCALPSEHSSDSFWHTEPSPLLTGHRSSRHLPLSTDVVVIGSGITGASVAHHLLTSEPSAHNDETKPMNVVMLEAREACWGATGRNGGHCQPLLSDQPDDPSIAAFELENFYALEQLITACSIDCEFVSQKGVRAIYSSSEVHQMGIKLGILAITAPDIRRRMTLVTDPAELKGLRVPSAKAALITDVAARMWPYKFVAYILENLLTSQSLRGTFNLQTWTPATAISVSQSNDNDTKWTVTTPRGTIKASRVVLATNAYTSHLLPSYSDLIVPCRGQMSALRPVNSLKGSNRLPCSYGFLGEGLDDYLIQRLSSTGEQLMFGGGRQHDAKSMGTVDDSLVDSKIASYLRSRLVEAFELPEAKGRYDGKLQLSAESEWTGIMGFSRDDLPWVGPVPGQAGLFVSAGYTGHGMPNAWLCGRAVAEMVSGSDTAEKTTRDSSSLPHAYLITEERIERVRRQFEDVGVRDWAEMTRAAQH
ncbi:Hypothetical protein R9X50_00604500 [Acrodontium crateriforme]|uniref:FAD dependent oxidoreductase domain-containing protein n=1 Tax=Acrodontium crateriforme TaxID=150365 RepID=A0AAQ3M7N2_9PEZI|nr:Hypothetical protein R9X50_00604500 [Acrodontium crateriforme]